MLKTTQSTYKATATKDYIVDKAAATKDYTVDKDDAFKDYYVDKAKEGKDTNLGAIGHLKVVDGTAESFGFTYGEEGKG
nr:hypothetical protein [Tanacetum cinerariifolium]